MKKTILSCCGIIMTTILSGQEIRISITPTYNVFHQKYVPDKPYDSPKLGLSTNLDYLFNTKKKLKFGVGLGYQSSRVLMLFPINPTEYYEATEKIKLCSISFKSIYKLSNEFYLSLDPSIDFRINHDPLQTSDNQTGFGISSGIGGNFKVSNTLSLNVEPRLWMHNIIPFHHVEHPFRLSFAGINLGLVYGHKADQ